LIEKYGELTWGEERDLFEHLVDAIVSQQLSVKASETIFGRFKKLFGKSKKFPTPSQILKMPDEKIRGAGLSNAKVKYVKSLAHFVESKELDLVNLKNLDDESVIVELTKVKGIGRWTAEMILIFGLRRTDVFSLGDLGLRKAVSNLYGVSIDDIKKIEEISLKWSPNRSVAARYLWKSLN
ncbi:MAG TPA: DNA-3-methyladenine glycosylase, partial [Candidatus Saccharimonadales bacterium]|nr:DNA-3-methyladenine glycosylase [Candidatus Saccharimonadales bacterium]